MAEDYRINLILGLTDEASQQMANKLKNLENRANALAKPRQIPLAVADRASVALARIEKGVRWLERPHQVIVSVTDRVTGALSGIMRTLASPLALLGAGAGLTGLIGYPLKIAGEMEQARIAMDYFAGSAQEGKKQLGSLLKFAAETPFEFPQLQEALIMLMGANYQFDQAMRALRAFGDAAGMTGAGVQGMEAAMLGFTQIAASGTLNLQDLRQVALNLRVPLTEFAKRLGIAETEITKVGEKAIPASKAMEAIVATLEEKYAGGMSKLSKSFLGLTSTLKDTARLAVSSFGAGMAEPIKRILADLVGTTDFSSEKFQDFLKRVEDAGRKLGDRIANLYDRIKEFVGEIAQDEEFKKLDLGGKIVFVLDKALDEISAWIEGPGGKKVQALMGKLAGIAAQAWVKALAGTFEGAGRSALEGNILGALGMGALGVMIASPAIKGAGYLLRGAAGAARFISRIAGRGGAGAAVAKAAEAVAPAAGAAEAAGWTKTASGLWVPVGAAEATGAAATGARAAGLFGRLGAVGRIAGRFALPVAGALDMWEILSARNKAATAVQVAGGWGGMAGGAKLGAMIGTAVFPGIGTAIGAGLGGAIGYFGGRWLAGKAVQAATPQTAPAALGVKGQLPLAISSPLEVKPQETPLPVKVVGAFKPAQVINNIHIEVTVRAEQEIASVADQVASVIANKVQKVLENRSVQYQFALS